ncbi:MAG TPA: DUF2007 domain-containing protein [Rhodobacteraceae bacterium]|nr:DUF2007 domain-containing protein [Paracoccaceae bacterium]
MKEILRTTEALDVTFATALLKGEGIRYFVLGENMAVLEGSIGIFPRWLMVAKEDAFVAAAVLRNNGIESGLPDDR